MTLINPVTQYPSNTEEQSQPAPGLDADMTPKADHGEGSYVGSGKLAARKALITGADSGIGRATAIAFAREGADVALNYLPGEQEDADDVAKIIGEDGRKVVQLPADVSVEENARKVVTDAVEQLGGLDVLVIVAGKQQYVDDLADVTSEQFDQTYKTNVYALFWMVQEALKHLPAGSSIITTSSIQAYSPSPGLVDYASTKAAINTFSKALAQQVAPKGIRVNVVAPGPVWTPLQVTGGQPTEALGEFGQQTPLGRAGQPAEMAAAYVYLASPESSYVTGETLNLNGGMPTP
ncbi:NAD(P)-dependent dehydrogenase, short-chain alcohol dehydrogenase family [Microlunatus sagamiharensis]|uniref:NAD(P)-dependent dehydrogenase, short-chain alcohol dehydrogenase family n=1 Tax=Microlunatus sagamiharensis TaxID=546874 RepID=A0A1H2N0P0_9ACTN|nr:SDR family oxidoreductase [Microlunatus sagamiharensis]SDU98818.1 NAD(P)-dependent dehydrogenase, short-chain alcohol dehydrogenase family [Microlunatus sagamiharensis]